jgi:hypothetical protein
MSTATLGLNSTTHIAILRSDVGRPTALTIQMSEKWSVSRTVVPFSSTNQNMSDTGGLALTSHSNTASISPGLASASRWQSMRGESTSRQNWRHFYLIFFIQQTKNNAKQFNPGPTTRAECCTCHVL